MDPLIKTGIVGFGASGRYFHAPFIHAHPGFVLKTIVERTKKEAYKIYPDVASVEDIDQLLTDQEIELVVITTPNFTHFEYAFAALEAGKHVVVEKPFTATAGQASELIRIARNNKRVLAVYQSKRFEGDFLTIKDLLSNELVGEPVEYESNFDRFKPNPNPKGWKEAPEEGVGLTFDLGSHLVDQVLNLFGSPTSVYADIASLRSFSKVDDYFDIRLGYPGFVARLKASNLVVKEGPRFVLHGKKGSFIKYGADPQEAALHQGRTPDEKDWGVEAKSAWGHLYTPENGSIAERVIPTLRGSYMRFYQNVFEAITQDAELIVKPEEAYQTTGVIEAAVKSAESGCKVAYDAKAL